MSIETVRLVVQAATLLSLVWAAGGALYILTLGGRSRAADGLARTWVLSAGLVGLLATLSGAVLQLLEIGGDWAAALDPFTIELFAETGGVSSALRLAGCAILILWILFRGGPLIALAGVIAVIASFAFSGHVVSHEPGWLLRLAVAAHVIAAAFWVGSLMPLRAAILRDPPDSAANLMDAFAARATGGLVLLVATGGALAGLLSGAWPWLWAETDWGRGLLLKLCLVAVLLGFAALHRLVMTHNLRLDRPGARRTFAASIAAEMAVAALIVVATVSFASRFSPTSE